MARNQIADKKRKKEPEGLIVSSSNSDSQNEENEDENEHEASSAEEVEEELVGVEEVEEDDDEEEEGEVKISEITSQRFKNKKENTKKKEKNNKKKSKIKDEEKENESALYSFPMNRISRIIKGESSEIRLSQESVFIINKASEKFLQLFSKEAYAFTSLDRKKKVDYKHLSSVVSKRRRFDFLSDFVPEKVKAEKVRAEDALKEIPSVET